MRWKPPLAEMSEPLEVIANAGNVPITPMKLVEPDRDEGSGPSRNHVGQLTAALLTYTSPGVWDRGVTKPARMNRADRLTPMRESRDPTAGSWPSRPALVPTAH